MGLSPAETALSNLCVIHPSPKPTPGQRKRCPGTFICRRYAMRIHEDWSTVQGGQTDRLITSPGRDCINKKVPERRFNTCTGVNQFRQGGRDFKISSLELAAKYLP